MGAVTQRGRQVRPSSSWQTSPYSSQAWWIQAKDDQKIQNVVNWWENSNESERREVDAVSGIQYSPITAEDAAQDRAEAEEELKAEAGFEALDVGTIRAMRKQLQRPYRWCWATGDTISRCHSRKNRDGSRTKRKCVAFAAPNYNLGTPPANVNMADVTLLPCKHSTPGFEGGKCHAELVGGHNGSIRYVTEIIRYVTGRLIWGICLHEGDALGRDGPSTHLQELQQKEHAFSAFIESAAAAQEASENLQENPITGATKPRGRRHHRRKRRTPRGGNGTDALLELIELEGEESENGENGARALIEREGGEHLEAVRSRFILGWLQGIGSFAVRCIGGLLEIVALLGAVAVKTVALAVNVIPWLFLQGLRGSTIFLKWMNMQWLRTFMFWPFCSIVFKFSNFLKDGIQWLLEGILRLFNKLGAMMAGQVWGDQRYAALGGTQDEPLGFASGMRKGIFGCCDQWLDGYECCESNPECCPWESDLKSEQRNPLPFERPVSNSFNPMDVCADVSDFYKPENIQTDSYAYSEEDEAYIRRMRKQLEDDIRAEKNSFYPGKAANSGGVWFVGSDGYTMIPDAEYRRMQQK